MPRLLPALVLALLLLQLVPFAEAAWTTTHTFPGSFRPNRTVTATYSVTSSSSFDLPIRWNVGLATCKDTTADGTCSPADTGYFVHQVHAVELLGGETTTRTFSVFLNAAEGTYTYSFIASCMDTPCTGQAVRPGDQKHGAFTLAYTNTWTRTISAPSPIAAGTTQTVTYTLRSTSVDDRDLTGTAELFAKPNGTAETTHGTRTYNVLANAQTVLSWTGVSFPTIGPQQLRVDDTSFPFDTWTNATVLGVHLHVTQPRETYAEGGRFSLYVRLEGHGAAPDPQGIANTIQLTFRNGTFILGTASLTTSATGESYATFQGAEDLAHVNWSASSTGTWNGIAYTVQANGTATFTSLGGGVLEDDVAAIRKGIETVQLEGVHLDELGSRNLLLTSARATAGVAASLGIVFLVFFIATRV